MDGDGSKSDLRYLAASRVQSPVGELADVEVRGSDDRKIGSLEGVLLDPAERRLRFFVVQTPGWLRKRRYLLPSDWPARVDAHGPSLHVDLDGDALARCPEFEKSSVPEYSDDDLLTALFHRRTA